MASFPSRLVSSSHRWRLATRWFNGLTSLVPQVFQTAELPSLLLDFHSHAARGADRGSGVRLSARHMELHESDDFLCHGSRIPSTACSPARRRSDARTGTPRPSLFPFPRTLPAPFPRSR